MHLHDTLSGVTEAFLTSRGVPWFFSVPGLCARLQNAGDRIELFVNALPRPGVNEAIWRYRLTALPGDGRTAEASLREVFADGDLARVHTRMAGLFWLEDGSQYQRLESEPGSVFRLHRRRFRHDRLFTPFLTEEERTEPFELCEPYTRAQFSRLLLTGNYDSLELAPWSLAPDTSYFPSLSLGGHGPQDGLELAYLLMEMQPRWCLSRIDHIWCLRVPGEERMALIRKPGAWG